MDARAWTRARSRVRPARHRRRLRLSRDRPGEARARSGCPSARRSGYIGRLAALQGRSTRSSTPRRRSGRRRPTPRCSSPGAPTGWDGLPLAGCGGRSAGTGWWCASGFAEDERALLLRRVRRRGPSPRARSPSAWSRSRPGRPAGRWCWPTSPWCAAFVRDGAGLRESCRVATIRGPGRGRGRSSLDDPARRERRPRQGELPGIGHRSTGSDLRLAGTTPCRRRPPGGDADVCGITGMLVRDGLGDDDRDEVAALTALMAGAAPTTRARGTTAPCAPSGSGACRSSTSAEAGHQPMVSADGRHVLVFNGEVYNYRELRTELEARRVPVPLQSDTEVVLQALATWGRGALARFNGMFALGLVPRRASGRSLLARDPVGIKPLSWWWSPEAFVFGSQYDQVVRHRRCERGRVDHEVLGLYLRLGFVPAALRPDRGHRPGRARPLARGAARSCARPAGASARLAEAPARTSGCAAARPPTPWPRRSTPRSARQLVADVPVGVFLSGGVDSPLVAVGHGRAVDRAGARRSRSAPTTRRSDESAAASAYAEVLGVEHHLRTIRGEDALALLDDVAQAYPEPFGDYSSFPTLLVSAAGGRAREGRALRRRRRRAVLGLPRASPRCGGPAGGSGCPAAARVRGLRRLQAAPDPAPPGPRDHVPHARRLVPRRPLRAARPPTSPRFAPDARRACPAASTASTSPAVPTDDELLQWVRRNELACHLPMVLQKVDRASMHHGLEVRVPLLDLELARPGRAASTRRPRCRAPPARSCSARPWPATCRPTGSRWPRRASPCRSAGGCARTSARWSRSGCCGSDAFPAAGLRPCRAARLVRGPPRRPARPHPGPVEPPRAAALGRRALPAAAASTAGADPMTRVTLVVNQPRRRIGDLPARRLAATLAEGGHEVTVHALGRAGPAGPTLRRGSHASAG